MPGVLKKAMRRNGVILQLCCCVSVVVGCAGDRGFGLRSRAGQSGDTIARDRRTVPRGTTIPPAGLGVDLVRSKPGGKNEATLTSFSKLGAPDAVRR